MRTLVICADYWHHPSFQALLRNALRSRYGSRVVTAALHGPVRYSRSQVGYGYPAGSLIDEAVAALPENRSVGFRTELSPFADAPMVGDLTSTHEGLTVSGYAEGYIAVAPIGELTPLTPITNFVTEENLAQAVTNFPGASPGDATVEDMNSFIAGNAEGMNRVFEAFR